MHLMSVNQPQPDITKSQMNCRRNFTKLKLITALHKAVSRQINKGQILPQKPVWRNIPSNHCGAIHMTIHMCF